MQRSFDDLGTPLSEVTFCVLDLETTGASPASCAITEVGAVKVRGGERLGTFQTLVNPGSPIPPAITYLTGITEAMVLPAPAIDAVLPSFLEFVGDSVVVGHNVRFDLSFLRAAIERTGRPPPSNRAVDTCALARRLVRDEVRDCKLATLARALRLPHQPSHRALDDAVATTDLLHALLERAGTLGVLALEDLFELPTMHGHPQAAKLRLTASLSRGPGVYLFRDDHGRVLYVGKATNVRARVRSYFSTDTRRKVGQLLRETTAIDHIPCVGPLEAAVLEVRLIHEHLPRFNRRAKQWRRYAYLKLTLDERFPRLSVVRSPRDDGCLYLGPLPSSAAARQVADAIESAVPLRRCSRRQPRVPIPAPCAAAQLGVATCPCAGAISEADYAGIVDVVVRGLSRDPDALLRPLTDRMEAMAAAQRFEEAAAARDRAAALARALHRQRRLDTMRRSGRLLVEVAGQGGALVVGGRLVEAWAGASPDPGLRAWSECELVSAGVTPAPVAGGVGGEVCWSPLPRELADEMTCVADWLDHHADALRVLRCDGELACPMPKLPRFEPRRPAPAAAPTR